MKNHKKNERTKIFEELDVQSRPIKIDEMPRRIDLCQKALTITSREMDPELWAMLQDDLATHLMQSPIGPRAENIEAAIQHFEQALEVRDRQRFPEEWASTLNNLATAYRDRIRGERVENIEKAINCYHEALEVRTYKEYRKDWAMTQFNLAGAYYKRIHGTRAENLECAIQHSHQALKVYTRRVSSHYWAQAKNTLGEVYRVRIRGSRLKNIERAIYHFKQALEVRSRWDSLPEDWAMIQNNLGNAYLVRIRGKRADNIEESIRYYEQALEVRKEYSPEWATTQYNLGNAYRNRIRGDQTENIEQSICYFHQALKVHKHQAFPKEWAQARNNLGNAYLSRIRGKPVINIERAIQHFKQALKMYTDQAFPEEWAQTQNNLGNAYLGRIRGNHADNLEESIRCYKSALKVRTREAFPEDWAETLNNLAGAERTRAAENIEQSIQNLQLSLEVYTRETLPQDWAGTQNNLAIAYTNRIQGERAENIEQALQYYQQALEEYTGEAFPVNCLKTARALGNLAFEQQRWDLARSAYKTAFDARDMLVRASASRTSKQTELGEAQNLPPRAAYAHVQLNNVQQAVEVLEKGRAQLLRESLERRWLENLPALGFKNLYDEYKQAMAQYETMPKNIATSENILLTDWRLKALEKIRAATTAIREKAGTNRPEYRYFMQALPFDEIQRQAQAKPLVYLCATSAGGLALVVSQQGIQSIKLPKLNQAALQKRIWSPTDKEVEQINERINQQKSILLEDIQAVSGGYFSMYALWSLKPFLKNISKEMEDNLFIAWQKTLDETTHWLWDAVMGELISAIKEQSEAITLIPIGQLAFLPLHAAWMEDASKPTHRQYALDEMNISYAPSAHALWQTNLDTQRPVEDLLAVENPDGSLVFSKDEVHAALDVFKRVTHLPGKEAAVRVVKKEMQSAQVLHFSTHGRAGWEKAEQARLTLADDGYLTLLDIFELDLNQARLAVLSACETGVPGLELIDEMIGLPAGMMQAGVPGVVGSLWSVNDGSTALLMARFYRFWRKEGKSPQEALRQAQRWLRDSLFESPYYWAAFTYTGV